MCFSKRGPHPRGGKERNDQEKVQDKETETEGRKTCARSLVAQSQSSGRGILLGTKVKRASHPGTALAMT